MHIFFDTSTFDRVEKDVKVGKMQSISQIIESVLSFQATLQYNWIYSVQVTLVAQLGLIGGTMGLFTGFSILSGIEILYFVAKFFLGKMKKYESNN